MLMSNTITDVNTCLLAINVNIFVGKYFRKFPMNIWLYYVALCLYIEGEVTYAKVFP